MWSDWDSEAHAVPCKLPFGSAAPTPPIHRHVISVQYIGEVWMRVILLPSLSWNHASTSFFPVLCVWYVVFLNGDCKDAWSVRTVPNICGLVKTTKLMLDRQSKRSRGLQSRCGCGHHGAQEKKKKKKSGYYWSRQVSHNALKTPRFSTVVLLLCPTLYSFCCLTTETNKSVNVSSFTGHLAALRGSI